MAQIVDHEERRRGIIAAATELVLSGGFGAATMRTIATRAGYANGALKYYFPGGKDEIIAAMFTHTLGEIGAMAGATGNLDTLDGLRAHLRSWFPTRVEDIPTGRLLIELWGHAMASDDLRQLYSAHLDSWGAAIVERIEHARAAGAVSASPPYAMLVSEYLSFTMGTVVMNLMFPGGERLPDIDHFLDGMMQKLSTPAG